MNQNKNLIIGANSTLVKWISPLIEDTEIISHKSIIDVDFKKYSHVFLFSWSKSSLQENVILSNIIPGDKLIFISTVAVFSICIRSQWNKYPNWKSYIEDLSLKRGAKVIRIGCTDPRVISKLIGPIPITTKEILLRTLTLAMNSSQSIFSAYELGHGGLTGFRASMAMRLYWVSRRLPPIFLFQAPIEFLIKKFLSAYYGYSADTCRLFADNLLLGFGALGSHVSLCLKGDISVVVSPHKNILLTTGGFKGSRIGKYLVGLSKFWHGVHIQRDKEGNHVKYVPLYVKRPRIPFSALKFEAFALDILPNSIRVKVGSSKVRELSIECKTLHLAAGPICNAQILQSIAKKSCKFTDHEIGLIGSVLTTEIIGHRLLKKIGPIIYGRGVFIEDNCRFKFMLDFRPQNPEKVGVDVNIYDDTSFNIFYKIIKRFSLKEINEAIFNKFGIGFDTKFLSAYIQIEVKDCINLNDSGEVNRKRLTTEDINLCVASAKNKFKTLVAAPEINLCDGQHIIGGETLLEEVSELKALINSHRILIHGSPSITKLGATHNTERQKSEISNVLKNTLRQM